MKSKNDSTLVFIEWNHFFKHKEKEYSFHERVKAFSLSDFETLFEQAGVYLLDIFGDYKLNKFRPETSERLVMIFK